jgi:PilZ domain
MLEPGKLISRRSKERGGTNRRAFPRWTARFELRVGTGKEMKAAEVIEIGEGGLSFYSAEPIAPESEINIEYRLDLEESARPGKGDGWVRVKSVVRHARDGKIGVEFLNLRMSNRLQILDFITALK